jgi:hypothetical protein
MTRDADDDMTGLMLVCRTMSSDCKRKWPSPEPGIEDVLVLPELHVITQRRTGLSSGMGCSHQLNR